MYRLRRRIFASTDPAAGPVPEPERVPVAQSQPGGVSVSECLIVPERRAEREPIAARLAESESLALAVAGIELHISASTAR